jgi:hypothetical protein
VTHAGGLINDFANNTFDIVTAPQSLLEHHQLKLTPELIGGLLACFAEIKADEGTLWLLNPSSQSLEPVWNSGPYASRFVGQHSQPLDVGLVSIVFVTEQCLCENEVYRNADQDPTLDRKLSLLTCSMIAVPFRFRGATRGVVSCVRLKAADSPEPDPAPFSASDLIRVTKVTGDLSASLELAGSSRSGENASQ